VGRLKPTPDYSLTPTGNPLTEEQIEEWRSFLLNEVGVYFGPSPVGANVLCDMAKAALRISSEKREQIAPGVDRAACYREALRLSVGSILSEYAANKIAALAEDIALRAAEVPNALRR